MQTRSLLHSCVPLVALLVTSGCAGFSSLGAGQKDGLAQVDQLLAHVERVHVESAVAKDRAQSAMEALRRLVAPEFKGDPASGHGEFVAALRQSEDQADALRSSVKPLRRTAESVFERWTADLESIGNLAMRQRSQERLEETRRRYDAVMAASIAAQLAYDTFNGDLSDHALFLEHDFNAASVAAVTQELEGLRTRAKELARRLDACAAACRAYVEFAAPSAQVAPPAQAAKTRAQSGAPSKPETKQTKPEAFPAPADEASGG